MEKTIDRRIVRTQKAIKQSFIDLLSKYELDQISIKMLTDEADIGRKTFYLHYVDKYDLMDTIIDNYLEELDQRCEKMKTSGMQDSAYEWFLFFDEHHALFRRLFRSHGSYSFRNKLLLFTMEQLKKKEQIFAKHIDEFKIQFLAYGVTGILEAYIMQEISAQKEEISKQLTDFVMSNLAE
ncbi:TetR/AcrR family transcriptional regulator [Candidatus Enterococcus willemsii]|uniref:HTH tetR-type domain-containing protein n=1 Tax=Candidatus Enterococcus willemsii TaxID=1857215 RepID=A0ABQ6YWA3_9ENTE|nr:TetR/AcrR family transcriptional regulator C-terminal domain-containing protein [Enterococcus sp. CU12B]KAF1301031.1 hypothetical protein BAU17_09410 [Enterococcus sp. CU12B]